MGIALIVLKREKERVCERKREKERERERLRNEINYREKLKLFAFHCKLGCSGMLCKERSPKLLQFIVFYKQNSTYSDSCPETQAGCLGEACSRMSRKVVIFCPSLNFSPVNIKKGRAYPEICYLMNTFQQERECCWFTPWPKRSGPEFERNNNLSMWRATKSFCVLFWATSMPIERRKGW